MYHSLLLKFVFFLAEYFHLWTFGVVAGMRPERNQQPVTSNIQINLVLACPAFFILE